MAYTQNKILTGRFVFASAYSQLSNINELTISSYRPIDEMIRAKTDIFEEAYKKYGRTKAEYEEDVVNNVRITTLISATGDMIYVPEYVVSAVPDVTQVPYARLVYTIDLGMQPVNDDTKYNSVLTHLLSIVRSSVGVNPGGAIKTQSAITWLPQSQHLLRTSALEQYATANRIPSTLELQQRIVELEANVTSLKCVIENSACILDN